MDVLKDKLQSTKVVIAVMVFVTATALLVAKLIPAPLWGDMAQTVLIGYAFADVAAKFAPKAPGG